MSWVTLEKVWWENTDGWKKTDEKEEEKLRKKLWKKKLDKKILKALVMKAQKATRWKLQKLPKLLCKVWNIIESFSS